MTVSRHFVIKRRPTESWWQSHLSVTLTLILERCRWFFISQACQKQKTQNLNSPHVQTPTEVSEKLCKIISPESSQFLSHSSTFVLKTCRRTKKKLSVNRTCSRSCFSSCSQVRIRHFHLSRSFTPESVRGQTADAWEASGSGGSRCEASQRGVRTQTRASRPGCLSANRWFDFSIER